MNIISNTDLEAFKEDGFLILDPCPEILNLSTQLLKAIHLIGLSGLSLTNSFDSLTMEDIQGFYKNIRHINVLDSFVTSDTLNYIARFLEPSSHLQARVLFA